MLSQMLKENKGYKTFPGIIPKQSACQITIDMGGGTGSSTLCVVLSLCISADGQEVAVKNLMATILPSTPMKFTECRGDRQVTRY